MTLPRPLAQAGPDPINGMENLAHLDMAVLTLAPAAGLPPVLPLARQIDTSAVMLVIGYPARPGTSALVDPVTGRVSQEIALRLRLDLRPRRAQQQLRSSLRPGRGSGLLGLPMSRWSRR